MNMYKPEGVKWEVKEITVERLRQALNNGEILEAKAIKTDEKLNLHLDFGDITGIIPYNEIEYSPFNTRTKSVAIMSRVGKNIKFKVKDISSDEDGKYIVTCSRVDAQKDCYDNFISKLKPGDIVQAHVCSIENYGIFCDIGCGFVALLPIENVSIVRITNPKVTLRTWKDLYAVVKYVDEDGKITLTHKELLGTWEQEVSKFKVGETVSGIARSIENYGIFVEISQNLSGLAEIDGSVRANDKVNVFIKDINFETMKIKLAIVSSETPDPDYIDRIRYKYTQKSGHIDKWVYSTEKSTKRIVTKFNS